MKNMIKLPTNFADYLRIDNAELRFEEATDVANKIIAAGIQIYPNMDHAAIFCDPPHLVADGLKQPDTLTDGMPDVIHHPLMER